VILSLVKLPGSLMLSRIMQKLIKPTLGTELTRDEVEVYLEETEKRASTGNIQEDSAKGYRVRMTPFIKSKISGSSTWILFN
jgi:hypothetical protein